MKIGVIGDDFTGSSDIALTLSQAGMPTVQYVGVPDKPAGKDTQAGVVSLKSRSCPVHEAVVESVNALHWLRDQGCQLYIFKYCSTFDSTRHGNIGPVIDALADALECTKPIIVCPAFPATGRTIYQGHLFVFDALLSESGMQNHPITPMSDPDLRRWLQHQTPHSVGHLPLHALRNGQARDHLLQESAQGRQRIVCDAVDDEDLYRLAQAAAGFPLVTGGSGIALGLPALFGAQPGGASDWQPSHGPALALSGSCSSATLAQVKHHQETGGALKTVSVPALLAGEISATSVLDWAMEQTGLPLISTSAAPTRVQSVQNQHGAQETAAAVEAFFATVAVQAVERGVRCLICAGGETSGAIVQALDIDAMEIGPMIDPGVPALHLVGSELTVALKSGNFGATDFFNKAHGILNN